MNKFLFLVLLFISTTASSQTTDSTFTKKKHTIGFAGIPLHILFLQEGVSHQTYNLSYKRQGKELNFRSSINYSYDANNLFNRSTTIDFIETSNDSTWNRRTTYDYKRNEVDVRFGLEKNWNKKRSTWLLGLDLVVGYAHSENQKNDTYFPYEFNDTLDFSTQETIAYFISNTNFREKTGSHIILGLSPAIGWEYPINKTFGFSIQYRPTISYRTGLSAKENKREYFDDGVVMDNPNITNTTLDSSWDDIRFNGEGFDLFLTVNF